VDLVKEPAQSARGESSLALGVLLQETLIGLLDLVGREVNRDFFLLRFGHGASPPQVFV
jgi:hypothetical protein